MATGRGRCDSARGRSSRSRLTALIGVILAVASAVGLSGCGGHEFAPPGNKIRGKRLTIYVSVPLDGASAVGGDAVVKAARLALAQIKGRIGPYRIGLHVLDDAVPTTERWSAGQTEIDAHIALADPSTIGYLGDYNSGASAVSIPLLNQLAIPQISPASSAVGLTSGALGAAPGEPQKYYPAAVRTFARVIPGDLVQADVQVTLQKSLGCRLTYIVDDGEFDGTAMGGTFGDVASAHHLAVVTESSYQPHASSYAALGQTIAQSHADCVLLSAIPDTGAAEVAAAIYSAVPHVRLFGTADLALTTFADPAQGGIPPALDGHVWITAAAGDPAEPSEAAADFATAYAATGGPQEPVAIDGYEAMSLMLDAIRRATHGGRRRVERSQVVSALFRTRDRASVLGSYFIGSDGDISLKRYDVYRVLRGSLVFWRSIKG